MLIVSLSPRKDRLIVLLFGGNPALSWPLAGDHLNCPVTPLGRSLFRSVSGRNYEIVLSFSGPTQVRFALNEVHRLFPLSECHARGGCDVGIQESLPGGFKVVWAKKLQWKTALRLGLVRCDVSPQQQTQDVYFSGSRFGKNCPRL